MPIERNVLWTAEQRIMKGPRKTLKQLAQSGYRTQWGIRGSSKLNADACPEWIRFGSRKGYCYRTIGVECNVLAREVELMMC